MKFETSALPVVTLFTWFYVGVNVIHSMEEVNLFMHNFRNFNRFRIIRI